MNSLTQEKKTWEQRLQEVIESQGKVFGIDVPIESTNHEILLRPYSVFIRYKINDKYHEKETQLPPIPNTYTIEYVQNSHKKDEKHVIIKIK